MATFSDKSAYRRDSYTGTCDITLGDILTLQPSLNDLLVEAKNIKDDGAFFCNHDCYALGCDNHDSFKLRMHQLVGWGSRHPDPRLHTSRAWELFLDALVDALPPCRNCGCVSELGNFAT